MNQTTIRLILLAALAIVLSCAWLAPLDGAATLVVDSGLKRAMVSFASARALNAVLSVAQSASISVGVGLTIGQILHPINQLVGQFAELMLAASVAFGAMKMLIVIGAHQGVSLLLTVVALWWSWLCWQGKARPSLLSKILLVLCLIRFAVPVVSLGNEAVFDQFLASEYHAAQTGISDIPMTGPSVLGGPPGKPPAERGTWDKMKDWLPDVIDVRAYVDNLKQSAEKWVEHIVKLIAVFLLQTLVVPLLLFWLLYRIGSAMLDPAPRRALIAQPASQSTS